MGVTPLFCCFNGQRPNCIVFTGLAASILSFAFLIWGVADQEYKRDGVEAIYIIAFVLVILCLLGFIALLILLNLASVQSNRVINNIGRIICLVILCMCAISLIFLFVAFIIQIVDYSRLNSFLKGNRPNDDPSDYDWATDLVKLTEKGLKIKSHEWAAVFTPSIISFIALVVMALVANTLYRVFNDRLVSPPIPNISQNTVPTVPNVTQPGLFPNNGPVPPVTTYAPYPVTIQQSGVNLNK